uniref:Uncharacterized protein n=1 Tax=Amblyomma cajennense TaxID=34607 RepID=A0A023FP08_AMBCJ
MPEASWRGYPRLFTERTSSLLSEAVQMLHRAKDVQERRWLQAFVQRLTKLAVDLERSTLSLRSSPAPSSGHESFQQEQTVPTTGQISPPPSPSSSGQGARTTTQESVQDEVRGLGRPDAVTQPNLFRDEGDDPLTRQLRHQWRRLESKGTAALDAAGAASRSGKQPHGLRSLGRVSVGGASSMEERDASLDLNKIQTLIALGMTEDATRALHKRGETESKADAPAVIEEEGDTQKASTRPTVAPTPLVASVSVASGPSKAEDDLIRQLEREKFQPGR